MSASVPMGSAGPVIQRVIATAYRIPTDAPEADGTFAWDGTGMVLAEVHAGDETGLGYSYASRATADVINEGLAGRITGQDAFAIPRQWDAMVDAVRNIGCCGMAGAFGFEASKYDVSIAAAERVLLPRLRETPAETMVLANGFSCREQIEQCTGRRTRHIAEAMAG